MVDIAGITICLLCMVSTAFLMIRRFRDFHVNQNAIFTRYIRIPHLTAFALYMVLNLTQILNFSSVFNNICDVWYGLTIICLFTARFVISTEMMVRCYIVFVGSNMFAIRKRFIIYQLSIAFALFIICLVINILFNESVVSNTSDLCIQQYNNTMTPIIMFHIFAICFFVSQSIQLIWKLQKILNLGQSCRVRRKHKDYRLMRLLRKFLVVLCCYVLGSIFILLSSLFVYEYYGLVLSLEGVYILCINCLIYLEYDKVFNVLCKVCNPREPPQVELQSIIDIIFNKYDKKYKEITLDILQENDGYLGNDVIDIIMDFISPIQDIRASQLYRPYWRPVIETKDDSNNEEEEIKYVSMSKYGGIPYLSANEEWPRCIECNQCLFLFLQLNMDTLPDEYKDKWLKHDDVYNNYLFQYFQCIKRECLDLKINGSVYLTRFIKIDSNYNQLLFKEAVRFHQELKNSHYTDGYGGSVWKENIISKWAKPQYLIQDEKEILFENDIYDFKKYKYDTPSFKEYEQFYFGIFDNLDDVKKEIENNDICLDELHLDLKKSCVDDKLYGYYTRFSDKDVFYKIMFPECDICGNYMNQMIYQTQIHNDNLFQFNQLNNNDNNWIAAIFICHHHPFQTKIIFMSHHDNASLL